MWLDALDGGPGLPPTILDLGDQTIVVMAIAADPSINGGASLFLRCNGDEISASIERENPPSSS